MHTTRHPTRFPVWGLLILLALSAATQSTSQAPPAQEHEAAALRTTILEGLAEVQERSLHFWQRWGLDSTHGGVHGTLDFAGQPVQPTSKGLVQQARHVWAFSTYHLHRHALSNLTTAPADGAAAAQQLPSAQTIAESTYTFMLQHMRDGSDGGLWHWNVSREGSEVIQSRKVLYGQWFVLYSFSQYYTAFGDASARDLALRTFHTIAARWHSPEFGSYAESSENGFPPESIGQGLGLSEQGDEQQVRTFNTLLHGIEALTALHKVTSDSMVLHHLLELLGIVCTRLQRTTSGLIWEEYNPAVDTQWTPAPGTAINYGHNLEAAWLVLDTLTHLQPIAALDPSTRSTYQAAAVSVGAAAARDGYDSQHGGVFEGGTAEGPVSKVKVWWVNAEAMLAFYKLHEHQQQQQALVAATAAVQQGSTAAGAVGGVGGDDEADSNMYLRMLADTVRFVKQHLVNHKGGGEQYWQVEADGTWQPSGNTDKDTAGNRWKSSYHSSRAPLFLQAWLSELDRQLLLS